MSRLLLLLTFVTSITYGQIKPSSGIYGELKIAFDKSTNQLTGYYENGAGYDETTGNPRFSCIFYLEGKFVNNKAFIKTYFPSDTEIIHGELIVNDKTIAIHLASEHGGCGNLEHFADKEPVSFSLDARENWVMIQYATKEKVYFYPDPSESGKRSAYILKDDIVYVEKVEGAWAYCSYPGKKITKGWMKQADLNNLK